MVCGPEFSDFLRELRTTLGANQGIGKKLGLGAGVWESYEQGKRLPEVETLFEMARTLPVEYPNRPVPSQAQFLAAWLAAKGLGAEESLVRTLRNQGPRRVSLARLSWLNPFVFTGERREEHPRTRLDCLIEPAAISDLRWILGLGLDPATELILDKELTARPWSELVQRYGGRDIVSISSGAVNAMTGLLIDSMVFRFDAMAEARSAYRAFVQEMDHLEDEDLLQAFHKCLAAADRLGSSQDPEALLYEARLDPTYLSVAEDVTRVLDGSTPSQFTSLFREGVVDPVMRRRYQPQRTNDYAVISFARHPFHAKDKVALVIAGTNGPATAGAIRLLATEGIEDWPLGAVMRIGPPAPDGVPKAEVVTTPYKPGDIVASIEKILSADPSGRRTMLRGIFGNWSDQELREWMTLVNDLAALLARR